MEATSLSSCTPTPSGARFYASEGEWLEGSHRFAHRARLQGIVTAESSAQDKLALFRKLFKGRDDVYVHGYQRKDGGIGYAPACKNEWTLGICPKKVNPRSPCTDCPNRAFAPVSDAALIAHFKGEQFNLKDVVGLYVLDEGRTSILVADFDKAGWKKEIAAYRRAYEEAGIDVTADTVNTLEQGRTPLVITKRKEQAVRLANVLEAECRTVFLLTSEGTAQEKKSRTQAARVMPNGERFAIVATGSYLGEGFDEPHLDTLMLATPASWEGVITQYSGRLHREHEGKIEVVVHDYIDASIPMLERMYKKRLRIYKKLGYELARRKAITGRRAASSARAIANPCSLATSNPRRNPFLYLRLASASSGRTD